MGGGGNAFYARFSEEVQDMGVMCRRVEARPQTQKLQKKKSFK